MDIDRSTLNEIVAALQPAIQTETDRQALVKTAFEGTPRLIALISYGGGAQVFGVLLVRKALDFGALDNGEQAVIALLNTAPMFGAEQAKVDAIINRLNGAAPSPPEAEPDEPDLLIEQVNLPTPHVALARKHIFISYASKDSVAFVDAYEKQLQDAGYVVWRDRDGIAVGDKWEQTLADAVQEAAVVNLIITPNSVRSKWVHAEVRRARELGKIIFPLVLEEMQTDADKAAFEQLNIRDTNYLKLANLTFDERMKRIFRDLDKHGVPKRTGGA